MVERELITTEEMAAIEARQRIEEAMKLMSRYGEAASFAKLFPSAIAVSDFYVAASLNEFTERMKDTPANILAQVLTDLRDHAGKKTDGGAFESMLDQLHDAQEDAAHADRKRALAINLHDNHSAELIEVTPIEIFTVGSSGNPLSENAAQAVLERLQVLGAETPGISPSFIHQGLTDVQSKGKRNDGPRIEPYGKESRIVDLRASVPGLDGSNLAISLYFRETGQFYSMDAFTGGPSRSALKFFRPNHPGLTPATAAPVIEK